MALSVFWIHLEASDFRLKVATMGFLPPNLICTWNVFVPSASFLSRIDATLSSNHGPRRSNLRGCRSRNETVCPRSRARCPRRWRCGTCWWRCTCTRTCRGSAPGTSTPRRSGTSTTACSGARFLKTLHLANGCTSLKTTLL